MPSSDRTDLEERLRRLREAVAEKDRYATHPNDQPVWQRNVYLLLHALYDRQQKMVATLEGVLQEVEEIQEDGLRRELRQQAGLGKYPGCEERGGWSWAENPEIVSVHPPKGYENAYVLKNPATGEYLAAHPDRPGFYRPEVRMERVMEQINSGEFLTDDVQKAHVFANVTSAAKWIVDFADNGGRVMLIKPVAARAKEPKRYGIEPEERPTPQPDSRWTCSSCGGTIGPDRTGRPMCYGCGPERMKPSREVMDYWRD